MKVHVPNLDADPIAVRHSELTRAEDSAYRSTCPVCKRGLLLIRRHPVSLALLREDRCFECGQAFKYLDDKINGESFYGDE